MPIDFWNKHLSITGAFPDYTVADVDVLLRARGAQVVPLNQTIRLVVAGDPTHPKVVQAAARGAQIVGPADLRDALGPILHDFPARLRRRFGEFKCRIHVFAAGPPATEATLERAESVLGALPPALAAFYRHHDGLSVLWTLKSDRGEPLHPDEPISWGQALHLDGPLWRELQRRSARKGFGFGLICIPPLATVLDTTWDGPLFSSAGATGKLEIGARKVPAAELFQRLWLLDAFGPYHQAALHVDRSGEASVLYGSDAGACWTDFRPVPVETYLESLVWSLGSVRPARIRVPLGRPAHYRQIAGHPFPDLRYPGSIL